MCIWQSASHLLIKELSVLRSLPLLSATEAARQQKYNGKCNDGTSNSKKDCHGLLVAPEAFFVVIVASVIRF